jgi:hypothetical protein
MAPLISSTAFSAAPFGLELVDQAFWKKMLSALAHAANVVLER